MKKAKKKWYKKWWVWVIVVLLVMSAVGGSDDNDAPNDAAQTSTASEETVSFELIAGEAGEYGELFTINKDTEFEETYYIYHIPAGTYTVTNAGEYLNQITVCSDEVYVTDAGWEEHVEVPYAKALKAGESDTFTIEDGQHIEIHEPAHFTLDKQA